MGIPALTDDELKAAVATYHEHGDNCEAAARSLGIAGTTFKSRIHRAARRGFLGTKPVLPGFEQTKISTDGDGNVRSLTQKPEHGDVWQIPDTHLLGKITVNRDPDGRIIQDWVRASPDADAVLQAMRTIADELKKELPRVEPTPAPILTGAAEFLLNQYTVTDSHFGMLAWGEETRSDDYDLKIAERLLLDWFTAGIAMAPEAQVGLLAQLGDLLHHDALRSITPKSMHVLDADSRLQKIIRIVIRTIRHVIRMLLAKHPHVHIIMAQGNHDESSSAWLREWIAVTYENEPRVTVDTSPDPFYAYEWGQTALFYHHGHMQGIDKIDSVWVGKFRDIYGRAKQAYGHIGHLHSKAEKEGNLMFVERHRTLAPPDAHASGHGWLSKRDAKVITYHSDHGEVFRSTLTPEMVMNRAA